MPVEHIEHDNLNTFKGLRLVNWQSHLNAMTLGDIIRRTPVPLAKKAI